MANDPSVVNCRFTFKCSMTWFKLSAIEGTDTVRYCNQCETAVHLCTNERQLDEHATKGHCVAYAELDDSVSESSAKSSPPAESRKGMKKALRKATVTVGAVRRPGHKPIEIAKVR